MAFLCRVSLDAAHMFERGSAIRNCIELRDLFYTPHDADMLSAICLQWRAQRGKARGPLRDAMDRCFVVWRGGTEQRRAHVCYHDGEGPSDNSDRTRDGAHEWVQQCLFRLGRLKGFDPEVEVKFDKGYRADVLWRRRFELEQRKRPDLCMEVDLTTTTSLEQQQRFGLRERQGWFPVALMDSGKQKPGRRKPNGAHVDLPRLLVRTLKETAKASAQGKKPKLGVEELFVDNVSTLAGGSWVNRSGVPLKDILVWIAQGTFAYIQVERSRRPGLKGKWAWVHVDDRDELLTIEKLDKDEQLARERELPAKSQKEQPQKPEHQTEEQQKLELDRQQLVDEFEHDAEKLAVLYALEIESEDTWAPFLNSVSKDPTSWASKTEAHLVEAVEQLSIGRRSVELRERLQDRARLVRTDAISDVHEQLDVHRTRNGNLGAEQRDRF